jgi:glycosyltransferase involved in cell wall biosynthesis
MRLVYLLTSLGIGGAERQATALAQRMARRGHAAALLVLRARQAEQWTTELETVYLDMGKSPGSLLAGMLAGSRFLRCYRPDLMHTHTFPANLAGRLLAPFVPSAQVLSTIHNVYEGGWQCDLAYRLSDSLSVVTTAVSQAVAEHAIQAKAVPAQKCRVVPNGIDTAVFQPNAERRLAMRASMDAFGEFVWLAAGRIVPAKDYPTLLHAFARVRQEFPEARLWIAGEAAPGAKERMRVETAAADVFHEVRWLGLRRDLPALLDAADGFVLSSAWEGMPLVVGEAMAMEKPVAATAVGGVRELLDDSGIVVPAHSAPRLAEAMLALMQRPAAERRVLGQAARRRIEDWFSMEATADRWEKLYLKVLASKR